MRLPPSTQDACDLELLGSFPIEMCASIVELLATTECGCHCEPIFGEAIYVRRQCAVYGCRQENGDCFVAQNAPRNDRVWLSLRTDLWRSNLFASAR